MTDGPPDADHVGNDTADAGPVQLPLR
jgi:hypothetical protein